MRGGDPPPSASASSPPPHPQPQPPANIVGGVLLAVATHGPPKWWHGGSVGTDPGLDGSGSGSGWTPVAGAGRRVSAGESPAHLVAAAPRTPNVSIPRSSSTPHIAGMGDASSPRGAPLSPLRLQGVGSGFVMRGGSAAAAVAAFAAGSASPTTPLMRPCLNCGTAFPERERDAGFYAGRGYDVLGAAGSICSRDCLATYALRTGCMSVLAEPATMTVPSHRGGITAHGRPE